MCHRDELDQLYVAPEARGSIVAVTLLAGGERWLLIAVALGGIAVAIYAHIDDGKAGRR